MNIEHAVYRTSLLLISLFRDCMERENRGIHSRIFSCILHPEETFVLAGQSQAVIDGAAKHPEHVVPCAFLIEESCRLIKQNVPDDIIAKYLTKHWKIVHISKKEAGYIDGKDGLNLKSTMPSGWGFENGDTFARLKLAKIEVLPIEKP